MGGQETVGASLASEGRTFPSLTPVPEALFTDSAQSCEFGRRFSVQHKQHQDRIKTVKTQTRPPEEPERAREKVGVFMDITKKLTNKTSEAAMLLELKASASEEETLSDHYVILKTLGKGNFAEIKLAYHLHTEVQVAIKVLPNGTKNDFSIKTKIAMYKMLDHPYIIKLFHIINTKEYTYMVLEHAVGGDLVSYIGRVGPLQEKQAQHIFTQLVCAVHYCHENGIAHRDIKLDNILLDDKGNIKLCDFGLATRVTPGQDTKGFCGNIEYCAPELFSDKEYDAKAVDIWSMGVVLYSMVMASFPFKAKTYSEMKEEMLDPKYHLPHTLSQNIANITVQLFTVKPEQRPKIYDIRQHQWLKAKEEFWKTTPSLEALCNNPNPKVVVAMWGMVYGHKDISACLHEKKFNNIMATYLILNQKSPGGDHSKYASKFLPAFVALSPADALTSVPSQRGLSEPALPNLMEEHQVHDEKGSSKKRMRSLSMPATLCCQKERNKCPHPAPKFAHKFAYLKSRYLALDSMICNWSSSRSLSSESISSASFLSLETPQEVNTPNNSSYTQSSGSYREVPHIVNITATYDIQRDCLQSAYKNSFDDVPPEGIPENRRSSLLETSKNCFKDFPPEYKTTASVSHLSRGWKRVKKRIGNCLRLLCCCVPASKRSNISQRAAEVENNAFRHMQLHGVPKMQSCVS
ncbi:sperm motility kinase X [Cricetulus griseus]|nr:sperm motility kinase X [Cricetulus griseus]